MGLNSRRIKDRACELAEGYEEARDEEFYTQFFNEMFPQGVNTDLRKWRITEDDVQGFIDNFDFIDEMDWALDKAEGEYEDAQDAKYQQMKDER